MLELHFAAPEWTSVNTSCIDLCGLGVDMMLFFLLKCYCVWEEDANLHAHTKTTQASKNNSKVHYIERYEYLSFSVVFIDLSHQYRRFLWVSQEFHSFTRWNCFKKWSKVICYPLSECGTLLRLWWEWLCLKLFIIILLILLLLLLL